VIDVARIRKVRTKQNFLFHSMLTRIRTRILEFEKKNANIINTHTIKVYVYFTRNEEREQSSRSGNGLFLELENKEREK
jgi:hypothetical protein